VRDFVTFEQQRGGHRQRFGGRIAPEWFAAPTFYFHQPRTPWSAPTTTCRCRPAAKCWTTSWRWRRSSARAGRDLTPAQARDHIVGYAIFNDWSARDLQAREMAVQLGPAKGKDSATTLGPFLVTADELERYRNAEGLLDLEMTVQVNGIETGRDTLANMRGRSRRWWPTPLAAPGPPRRRARLRHLRFRLPGRAVGPQAASRTRRRSRSAMWSP